MGEEERLGLCLLHRRMNEWWKLICDCTADTVVVHMGGVANWERHLGLVSRSQTVVCVTVWLRETNLGLGQGLVLDSISY